MITLRLVSQRILGQIRGFNLLDFDVLAVLLFVTLPEQLPLLDRHQKVSGLRDHFEVVDHLFLFLLFRFTGFAVLGCLGATIRILGGAIRRFALFAFFLDSSGYLCLK